MSRVFGSSFIKIYYFFVAFIETDLPTRKIGRVNVNLRQ